MTGRALTCLSAFLSLLSIFISPIAAEVLSPVRAIWVPAWDMNTPEEVDHLLEESIAMGANQLLVQVRYRGDALYRPNRESHRFYNPEVRFPGMVPEDFDALDDVLRKAQPLGIEVHAWVTVFVVTGARVNRLPTNHPYFLHPDWITMDRDGRLMMPSDHEGVFFDPALPEVQDYLIGVFGDIVDNYPSLNGLHLDYIRYPGNTWGFHPRAMELSQISPDPADSAWNTFRCDQITRFVRRLRAETLAINPRLQLTAAVMSNKDHAVRDKAQDWLNWLRNDLVDRVYLMAYSMKAEDFRRDVQPLVMLPEKERIVIGLRAWSENGQDYRAESIRQKFGEYQDSGFAGFCLFSSVGIRENGYHSHIRRMGFGNREPADSPKLNSRFVFGYLTAEDGSPLTGRDIFTGESRLCTTDQNGFFLFATNGERALDFHLSEMGRMARKWRYDPALHRDNPVVSLADCRLPPTEPHVIDDLPVALDMPGGTLLKWNPESADSEAFILRRETGIDDPVAVTVFDSAGFWFDENLFRGVDYTYTIMKGSKEKPIATGEFPQPVHDPPVQHFSQNPDTGSVYCEMLIPAADSLAWRILTPDNRLIAEAGRRFPVGRHEIIINTKASVPLYSLLVCYLRRESAPGETRIVLPVLPRRTSRQ